MIRFRYLLCCFLSLGMLACKKDKPAEIADLVFPSDTYYVSTDGETILYINQGNKKYQLSTDDETVIQAQADDSPWPAGQILVKGLKKGTAVLTVKDEVNGKEVPLKIHVVDPFLVLKLGHAVPAIKVAPVMPEETRKTIREEAKSFADFELENVLILHRNAARRFFVFDKGEELSAANLKRSGTYELVYDAAGQQRLSLSFDGEGTMLTLGVLANSAWAKHILQDFADSDQGTPMSAAKLMTTVRAESPVEYFDRYIRVFKDLTSHFNVSNPDVESVELYHEMLIWPDFQDYSVRIGEGVLK